MAIRFVSRTLPYLRAQGSAFLGNASIFVKSVSLILLLFHLGSFSESFVETLSVIPGYFLPPKFYLWTAFTHAFLEVHLWEVFLDIFVLFTVGKLVEPLWGLREMAIFFLVVNVGVAVASGFFYYLLYMLTFNENLLFHVRIHGLAGYIAGASVAVKQILPDVVLYHSPMGKITNRNVPLSLFLLSLLSYLLGIVSGSYSTMFGSGLLISWTYLRFYQNHSNGSRGDMTDSFGFPSFFPNVLQPILTLVCNGAFSVLVRLRVCKKPVRKYELGSANSISLSLPGAESHDTERRRQIALKALSERLSKSEGTTNNPTAVSSEWPKMMEEKEESVQIPINEVEEEEKQPLIDLSEDPPLSTSIAVEQPNNEEEEGPKKEEED